MTKKIIFIVPPVKEFLLVDYTNVETIYQKKLKTVTFKIRPHYVANPKTVIKTVATTFDVFDVLKMIFSTLDDDQEHFILLVLNQSNDIIGYKLIASGAQDRCSIDTKIIFRNALLLGARKIIVAHNHTSEDLNPSDHDLTITKTIAESGNIVDIPLLDHIIFTPNNFTSLKKEYPDYFEEKIKN